MAQKTDYSEQLKSPKWQKKRLQILELHDFTCEKCGNKEKTLHVHHTRYIKGRKVWEYDNDVLEVLCEDCHVKTHNKEPEVENLPKKYKELLDEIKKLDELNPDNSYCISNMINEYLLRMDEEILIKDFFIELSHAFHYGLIYKINFDLQLQQRITRQDMNTGKNIYEIQKKLGMLEIEPSDNLPF